MKTTLISARTYVLLNLIGLVGIYSLVTSPRVFAESTVYSTTLGETNSVTPEINTEQLRKILADRSGPVLDVRFAQEYAIAHIPESINIYEKEGETITQRFPDKATPNRAVLQWTILWKEQTSFR
jgi:Rhodanese-like domain